MRYKKSSYNVIIDELEGDRKLVYNTYSGSYGIMGKKMQEIYRNIENFNIEDISDERVLKSLNAMHTLGYIVDVEKDELITIKLERAARRVHYSSLQLTIAPTMDCNMCCPYCYEDKKNFVMSDEIQEQLVNFIKTHFDRNTDVRMLSVVWYGGEPLLQKDIIYNLSKRFVDLCNEKEKMYKAAIITNGALLDVETAKRLAEDCKVESVQITIDGIKEMHNKRRILISGEDSFDIITKNIDAIKDILPINVRVNVDKENAEEMDTLVRFFIEEKNWKGRPSFSLSPVDIWEDSTCVTDKSLCLQGEEFAEVNLKSVRASYAANRDDVVRRFFPRRRAIFCSGEGPFNYIIDPEGYLYNCFVPIGKKEQSTGHVSKPFMATKEYGKWVLSDIPKRCESCEYLPLCMGGCGLLRIPNGGEPECFHTSYTYKDLLKLAYEDYVIQQSKQITTAEMTSETVG